MRRTVLLLILAIAGWCHADYLGSWALDDYLPITATTHRFSTGNAYDATSITYRIYEDVTAAEIVADTAMTKFDGITGFYLDREQLTAAVGFEQGKCYTVLIQATVDGVTGEILHSFQVRAEVNAVIEYTDALDPQPATYVLAGPVSGPDAAPTFRALVSTDISALFAGTASEIDLSDIAGVLTFGIVDPLGVTKGGSGVSTLTTAYGLLAAGTTATGAVQTLPAGLATQVLVGGGAAALPAWGADLPTAVTIGSAYIYRAAGTDVPVTDGGTGLSTLTTPYGLLAAGTTATGTVQTLAAGLTTQILVGGGAAALPAWGSDIPTAVTIGSAYIYRAGGTDVPVSDGGTGASTLTDHGILLGSGTDAITPLGSATNGQIPIGSTGADPVLANITGTANRVTVTDGAGTITLSGPQDIHTGASPTFTGLTIDTSTLYVDPASHRVGIGTTSLLAYDLEVYSASHMAQIAMVGDSYQAGMSLVDYRANVNGSYFLFAHGRGTKALPVVVNSGDRLGAFNVYGWSGAANTWLGGTMWSVNVDGTPDSGGDTTDMPMRHVWNVIPDGSATASEAMRLSSAGNLGVGGMTNPQEDLHAADTVRADTAFNLNGTDGVTQASAAGKVCDVTALAGGIATAQTQITYAADGTYNFDATSGKVSSITITNGRITAITTAP